MIKTAGIINALNNEELERLNGYLHPYKLQGL
jgi:hypothetical protein